MELDLMKNYNIDDVKDIIHTNVKIICDNPELTFDNFSTIEEANEKSLIWIKKNRNDILDILSNTKASFVILEHFDISSIANISNKCLIMAEDPKLVFSQLANSIILKSFQPGIDKTAQIHPEAEIADSCYIGCFVSIGKVKIGKNCIINNNVTILDNSIIGNNVIIGPGTVIGSEGFGYSFDEHNNVIKFPHIGGVLIEDNVEIGANTCIDRGALGNTIIRGGTKIDNLVHIAHNVEIGENSLIIANSMIGGSVKIQKNSWIAPSASLMNQVIIGENVTVGMGSVVTKSIPNDETWTGIPARKLTDFLKIQGKLKDMLNEK